MVESQKRGGREADDNLDGLGRGEVGGGFNGQGCACNVEGEGVNDGRLCTEVDFIGVCIVGGRGSDDEVYWEAVGDGVEERKGKGDLAEFLLSCYS